MLLITSIIAAVLTIILSSFLLRLLALEEKIKLAWGAGVTKTLKELFVLKATLPNMFRLELS